MSTQNPPEGLVTQLPLRERSEQGTQHHNVCYRTCYAGVEMGKSLVGHHLMRVRIRKSIFTKLQEVAEEESERSGDHVTVSDLVRAACYNFLLIHESVKQLENTPPVFDEEEILLVHINPMLA